MAASKPQSKRPDTEVLLAALVEQVTALRLGQAELQAELGSLRAELAAWRGGASPRPARPFPVRLEAPPPPRAEALPAPAPTPAAAPPRRRPGEAQGPSELALPAGDPRRGGATAPAEEAAPKARGGRGRRAPDKVPPKAEPLPFSVLQAHGTPVLGYAEAKPLEAHVSEEKRPRGGRSRRAGERPGAPASAPRPELAPPQGPVSGTVLPRGGAASGVPNAGYRPGEQPPTTEEELDAWFARRGFRLKRVGHVPDNSPERRHVIQQFGEHHATLKPLLRILKLEEGNARHQELGGPGTTARAFAIYKQALQGLEACYRVAYLEIDEAKRHFTFDVTIPPHDYAYMVGMWFEAYATDRAVSALGTDQGVFTNVQVELPNGAGAEIDLVISRPNGVYLLECKAGKAGPGLDRFKEVSSLLSGAGAVCAVLIPGDAGSQVRQLGAHHKLAVVTPDDLPAHLGVAPARAPQATASGEALRAELARHAPKAVARLKDAGLVLAVRAKPTPSELLELAILAQAMGMDYPNVFPLLDHAASVAGRPNEVTLGLARFGAERAAACIALAKQFEEHGLLSKLKVSGKESIRYVPTAEEPYAGFMKGTWLELYVAEALAEACGLEQVPPLVRLASANGRDAAVGWLADLGGEALWVGRFAPGLDAGWAEGHAHIAKAMSLPAGRGMVVTAGGPNQPPGKGLLRLRPHELPDCLWGLLRGEG